MLNPDLGLWGIDCPTYTDPMAGVCDRVNSASPDTLLTLSDIAYVIGVSECELSQICTENNISVKGIGENRAIQKWVAQANGIL